MTLPAQSPPPADVVYPDSDGLPMANTTVQFRWIVTLESNLEILFRDRNDIFIAGDLLWYPVKGDPTIRAAPHTMVVFGRPPGDRGSYNQWEERNTAPQVVFEVLSPGNARTEMAKNRDFYEKHGVEEYYLYDPDGRPPLLRAWFRQLDHLIELAGTHGLVSPRLGIRFDLSGAEMQVFGPDGRRFMVPKEIDAERREAEERADIERERAEEATACAESERQRRQDAENRSQREAERTTRLEARLRALGIDPDTE